MNRSLAVTLILLLIVVISFPFQSCEPGSKQYVGIIVEELEPIETDTGELYPYKVKEFNNPEYQLVVKYFDIHDVGDTLIYTRKQPK